MLKDDDSMTKSEFINILQKDSQVLIEFAEQWTQALRRLHDYVSSLDERLTILESKHD